jgi:GNAT superfamily N-acetyltransferase
MAVITFKYKYPIEQTMEFEQQYKEQLQMELQEKRELTKDSFTVWMFVDDVLTGEIYGLPFENLDEEIEGCSIFTEDEYAIYLYSITILPTFQRQGYGEILLSYWLGLVVAGGYSTVIGHFRPGGSTALAKKFGGKSQELFHDWYGTGEDYEMFLIELKGGI